MIKIFSDFQQLTLDAAQKFVEIGGEAIAERGKFTVALSGGSTPKSLFNLLTTKEFKARTDWTKTFFFFGDERNVSPDDTESNFRMARENLFEPLKISGENIFRWRTEIGEADKIAADYQTIIKEIFKIGESEFPRFDLILLGMGDDGHTASLFPFTKALNETEKIAVSNSVAKLQTERFTLTFPAINNAANIIFLVKGAEKAETLRAVLEDEQQPEKLPAQAVRVINGNLYWLVDQAAARFLKR